MPDQETLGDLLIAKRGNASQAAIGEVLGVSQSTYQRWETDDNVPDADSYEAVLKHLGVSFDRLGGLMMRSAMRKAARQKLKP